MYIAARRGKPKRFDSAKRDLARLPRSSGRAAKRVPLREIVCRRSTTSFALNYQLGCRMILPFPAAARQITWMRETLFRRGSRARVATRFSREVAYFCSLSLFLSAEILKNL